MACNRPIRSLKNVNLKSIPQTKTSLGPQMKLNDHLALPVYSISKGRSHAKMSKKSYKKRGTNTIQILRIKKKTVPKNSG